MVTKAAQTDVTEQVRNIVMLLMKRPITEDIAIQVESEEGFEHLEIENGEWVGFEKDEYMGGEEHGWVETLILHAFTDWVLAHHTGRIYPGDTDFVLKGTPDNIQLKRRPDIGFVSSERVRASKGYVYAAPDLAVEIISPTERPGQIRKKLREYLDNGAKQVWHVYADSREIVVHFPDGMAKTYHAGETLPGGDLLPGFTLDVAGVFEG